MSSWLPWLGLLLCLDASGALPTGFTSVSVRFVNDDTIQLDDGSLFFRRSADPLRGEEGSESEFNATNLSLTIMCVVGAAMAAGLTMGLVSLDEDDIKLVIEQGVIAEKPAIPGQEHDVPDEKERQEYIEDKGYAEKLQFFASHGHWTMVTLLLLNAGCAEALPIFLDKLVPSPVIAILISVTAVLIFGEILPTVPA